MLLYNIIKHWLSGNCLNSISHFHIVVVVACAASLRVKFLKMLGFGWFLFFWGVVGWFGFCLFFTASA